MDVLSAARTPTTRPSGSPKTAWRWSYHGEILIASFASLLVEIGYTRLISYKLFYYYVYLVIGLALLGIGSGGVLVSVSERLRRAGTDQILFWSLLLGACTTVVAYVVVAKIQLDTLSVWRYGTGASVGAFALLLLLCLCVFASFVAPGVIAAVLFGRRPESIGGLYFADLLGAGIACGAVIYLVTVLGAPATVMLAAAAMTAGALWLGVRLKVSWTTGAAVVLAGGIVLTSAPSILPPQALDTSKVDPLAVTTAGTKDWGPIFRVDVGQIPGYPDALDLYHDGILGSGIYRWDGTRAFLDRYNFPQDPRAIPFSVLGPPPASEAVIGAAGGHEVLASLYFGARHVDAVELNPVTVNLVRNTYANYDGHLAQNPAVNYVTADGRSFMARSDKHYNLVWYPAPDSYAATNGALSSAYVLSESYLFTTNGIQADLQHLAPGGLFVAQFGEVDDVAYLRTSRFVATARQALANIGIHDPTDHILVSTTQTHFFGTIPTSTILVSPSGFTPQQVQAFVGAVHTVPETTTMYAPGVPASPNPVQSVVTTSNAKIGSFYSSYPYNIAPTTDQDPFFYHFARYTTVLSHFTRSLNSLDRENSVGERVLLLLLGLSIVISAVFLLLPFVTIRKAWRRLPRKGLSAIFFAGVGFGFIFFEITLMQLLNLFLGYPTYSLTVVLVSLLIFSGVGALLSQRVKRRMEAIPLLFLGLLAVAIFYLFGLTPVTNSLLSAPLAARVALSVAFLAPLGLSIGMFMPIGLGEIAKLSDHSRQYVAWGWAVNGFASVVGSALATILSMIVGFNTVLFLGLVCYLLATGAWGLLAGFRLPGLRRGAAGASP